MRVALALASLVSLTGCAGSLYTIANPTPDASGKIAGILVYQPKTVILITEATVAQDANGNVVGSVSGQPQPCMPVRAYELTTVADYSRPYAVGYHAALFESKKLSLELEKGVLVKINSESTAGIKEVADLVSTVLSAAKDVASREGPPSGTRTPLCNAGKKLVGVMTLEDLCHQTATRPCP